MQERGLLQPVRRCIGVPRDAAREVSLYRGALPEASRMSKKEDDVV